MKARLIALSALLLCMATTALADGKKKWNPERFEKARAMQVDRIVNELELSDANAERFTALYGQYTAEMHEAARKHARIHPEKDESGKPKRLSDEQIKHNIEAQFALSQATLDIRRKYYKEYLKFLTPRQIEHLSRIEKKQAEKFHKSFGQRKGQARPVKPTAHQAFQGRPGRFQGHRAAAPQPVQAAPTEEKAQ